MGIEAVIVFAACGIILLLIMACSWYRRKKITEKELQDQPGVSRIQETVVNGQRTFRIATVSRNGDQVSLDVYEIRLPRPNDPTSTATIALLPSPRRLRSDGRNPPVIPPPPFSTAVNMPSPADNLSSSSSYDEESPVPPPRYEEVIPISTESGLKLSENVSTNNQFQPRIHAQLPSTPQPES